MAQEFLDYSNWDPIGEKEGGAGRGTGSPETFAPGDCTNGVVTDLERSLLPFEDVFAICRLDRDAPVPEWATKGHFFSVARTPDELSVVCPQTSVPRGNDCETGWRCLKIESPFEFDLSGMISSIAAPVAEADIDVFVVATQDSDYLMVRERNLKRTISMLSERGYRVELQRG